MASTHQIDVTPFAQCGLYCLLSYSEFCFTIDKFNMGYLFTGDTWWMQAYFNERIGRLWYSGTVKGTGHVSSKNNRILTKAAFLPCKFKQNLNLIGIWVLFFLLKFFVCMLFYTRMESCILIFQNTAFIMLWWENKKWFLLRVYFLILKIVYNVGKRACKMKQYYFVWILKMKEWYLIILSTCKWTMLKEIEYDLYWILTRRLESVTIFLQIITNNIYV